MEEQICFWCDADGNYYATRCTIDIATGMPIGLPAGAESLLIIEFEKGYEPMLYNEAHITEMGVENAFP